MTNYTARDYHPGQVVSRYVRLSTSGAFEGCEVGHDRRYNLRTWELSEGEIASLSPAQIERCKELQGMCYAYVDWQLYT